MFSRTKHKDKNTMGCLVYKILLQEKYYLITKNYQLLINGGQAVKYESGLIKFTNYNKQIPIPFKIYAGTECFLKRSKLKEGEHTVK